MAFSENLNFKKNCQTIEGLTEQFSIRDATANLSMRVYWNPKSRQGLSQNLQENWDGWPHLLDVSWWYGLKNIFFRNNTFLFCKIESWNFQVQFEIKFGPSPRKGKADLCITNGSKVMIYLTLLNFKFNCTLVLSGLY